MPYKDKEKAKAARKKYYETHKEKLSNHNKKYYNAHKEERKEKSAKYYNNNRSTILDRTKQNHFKHIFRPGEQEKIENYELAKQDNFIGWTIHHRLELTLNNEYAHNVKELKRFNMYFNRPYFELIYLKSTEHARLHNLIRWKYNIPIGRLPKK